MAQDLDSILQNLKIEEISSSSSPSSCLPSKSNLLQKIIDILRPCMESGKVGECLYKILTPTVMSTVRESLLVSTTFSDPIQVKRGMYVLKSIVSYLIEPKSSSVRDDLFKNENEMATEILLTLGYNKFKSFWQLFFDAYDILNEKQTHIVNPYVKRMQNSHAEFQQYSEVTPWLVILEIKMMMHDNRSIAKDGLELFLNSICHLTPISKNSNNKNNQSNGNSILLYYLQTTVFPIIREKIYWILPEAIDFYNFAQKLGKLVERISDQDLPVQTILNYLKTSSKDFGTVSLYFLTLAAKSCVVEMLEYQKLKSNSTPSSSSVIIKDNNNYNEIFIPILTTVSDIIIYRVVSCSKFLKKKIQVLLLELLLTIQKPEKPIQFHCSQLNSNQEEIFLHFFTFLGSLDKDIFCTYRHLLMPHLLLLFNTTKEPIEEDRINQENKQKYSSTSYFKWILQEQETSIRYHKEILYKLKSLETTLKFKGYFRWILLHFQQKITTLINQLETPEDQDEKEESKLAYEIRKYTEQLLNPNFISTLSTEQMKSLLDFTKNIVTIQKEVQKYNSNSFRFVPLIQFLFHTAFTSLLEFVNAGHVSNSICNVNFIRTESLFSIIEITNEFKGYEDSLKMIKEAQLLLSNGIMEYTNLAYLVLLKTLNLSNSEINCDEKVIFSNNWTSLVFQKCFNEKMNLDLYSTELVDQPIEIKHCFISKVNDLKLWTISNIVLKMQRVEVENKHQFLSEIVSTVLDLIDSGTHLGLIYIFEILQQILFEAFTLHLEDIIQLVVDFVPEAWKHTLELHTSRYFSEVFIAFCTFVTQPHFSGYQILSQYCAKILEFSETVSSVTYSFTCALKNVCEREDFMDAKTRLLYDDYLMELLNVNLDIACTTPILFKSARVEFNLWSYICGTETGEREISTNYDETLSIRFSGNNKSRIIAILNILKLYDIKKVSSSLCDNCPNSSEHIIFLNAVVDKLLYMNDHGCPDNRRNFSGSYFHRFRQRIMQFLLVLQPLYNLSISTTVMKKILTSIGIEAPLTIVRYLSEWIVVKILIAYPELQAEFFKISEESLSIRVGYGAFYSTMILHAAQHIKFDCNNPFFLTALQRTSDLLMNQNFSVRIYGNIALTKIFEKVQSTNFEPLIVRFQAIYDSAKRTVETAAGNYKKIYNNAANDFYISKFNAVNDFYYDVIFILLPGITKMSDDETIHRHDLKSVITKHGVYNKFQLELESPPEIQQPYLEEEEYVYHLRSSLVDGREQGEETKGLMVEGQNATSEGNPDTPYILQWKYLPTSTEILDFPEEVQLKKRSRKDKLILVASLIENMPNLGGLCRTSEIFGVSKYVISNFKVLEDTQFKSLSVSSHRWIDILEVPVKGLIDFLKEHSSRGYSIVAVEQAMNSIKLHDFQFPEKTVLLLGNEKSGVPTELLHLVDYCVEIPQHGLTRSLNVHVSGSLVLYTYALQHIL